jgi:hypothetical protein
LALHELAGPRVRIELPAPEPDFVYRPTSVAEPFERGLARGYPLAKIAQDVGIDLRAGWLAAVDPANRRIHTRAGEQLRFEPSMRRRVLPARSRPSTRQNVANGSGRDLRTQRAWSARRRKPAR